MFPPLGKELGRLKEIIKVLHRYGFGVVLRRLHLYYRLPFRRVSPEAERLTPPQRVRRILEELGPTFIKFGQVLSTRSDLLPKEYIDELKKLQDKAPSFPFEEVRGIVEEELGISVEDVFESIEPRPLASASLAQVHRARLRGGEEVVLKVQRPGIEKVIESDLSLLLYLARQAEKRISELSYYQPSSVVRQLAITIRKELDFLREGRNTERFANNFSEVDYVIIPQVYWDYSTERLLTLEYLEGIKIDHVEELEREGYDLKLIAERGAEAFMWQVFVHGLFQADPHPGNVLVMEENRLGLIDFGQVGRVRSSLKENLIDLAIAIVKKDPEKVADVLLEVGAVTPETPIMLFRNEVEDLISEYYGLRLSQVSVASMVHELFDISLRYHIRMPPDFAFLIKSIMTSESIGRQLYEDFNLSKTMEPFVKELIKERTSPRNLVSRAIDKGEEVGEAIVNMPLRFQEMADVVTRGVVLRHSGLEDIIEELDAMANRLSFAMVTAAIIIGSSLVMTIARGPMFLDLPVFGLLGFIFASVLGTILLVKIIKSGKL